MDLPKMRLPVICPSCMHALSVSTLTCKHCDTAISGSYPLPAWLQLGLEEQELIIRFFLKSGSIKDLAAIEGVSYPTMRNRLDDLIAKIKNIQNSPDSDII